MNQCTMQAIKPLKRIGFYVAYLSITISFLFTTPGVWHTVDGVPVTDFFILKDLVALGFGGIIIAGVDQI